MFDKNSHPDFSNINGPKTEQYGTANYVGIDYQTSIKVYNRIPFPYFDADISAAIDLWNSIPNCRVKFELVPTIANAMITINVGLTKNNPQCGASDYPMDGKPGPDLLINIYKLINYSPEQRKRVFAHELGHCIGLRHTNWQGLENQSGVDPYSNAYYDAMHLLGTPTGGDPNSLTNEGECGIGATTFSSFDILAIQFLYPAAPTVPGSIPVYRYFSRSTNGDHLLTTTLSEKGNGSNSGTIFEGIGMFAFMNQIDNTIPVYRYYLSGVKHHYYTTNPLDIPTGGSYEG